MEQKIYKKEEITDDMKNRLVSSAKLCGFEVNMESAATNNAGMYTSSALVKMEKLAGYDGHHIERLMEKEFSKSLSLVANEISTVHKKALENMINKTMDYMCKEVFGECQNSEKDS